MLQEFDVPYINVDGGPQAVYQVPGGGQMFRQYILSQRVLEADALVDVQKMKNHAFMGITLTLKNLFGLMTQPPAGKPATTSTTSCVCPTCLRTWGGSSTRL